MLILLIYVMMNMVCYPQITSAAPTVASPPPIGALPQNMQVQTVQVGTLVPTLTGKEELVGNIRV